MSRAGDEFGLGCLDQQIHNKARKLGCDYIMKSLEHPAKKD